MKCEICESNGSHSQKYHFCVSCKKVHCNECVGSIDFEGITDKLLYRCMPCYESDPDFCKCDTCSIKYISTLTKKCDTSSKKYISPPIKECYICHKSVHRILYSPELNGKCDNCAESICFDCTRYDSTFTNVLGSVFKNYELCGNCYSKNNVKKFWVEVPTNLKKINEITIDI